MLQHFHAGDDVEGARGFGGQFLHRHLAIIDLEAGLVQVQTGGGQHPRRDVDSGHLPALARQRLRQDAAAAADVENGRAVEPGAIGNVLQTRRIEIVQRAERPFRVPPTRSHRVEFLLLGTIDVRFRACAHPADSRDWPCRSLPSPASRACQLRARSTTSSISMVVSRPDSSTRRPATQTSETWRDDAA